MIHQKKIQFALLMAVVILSLTACSGGISSETESVSENTEPSSSGSMIRPAEDHSDLPAVSCLPLELADFGWYIDDLYGDTVDVYFCGMIHNPNDTFIARFPSIIVTVKDGDGNIAATEKQVGSDIMPRDTITLCGMLSMSAVDLTEEAEISFDADCTELENAADSRSGAKTTDFVITHITERGGNDGGLITGEITNQYSEDVDMVNISLVLRKDGEIVYIQTTFLDNLKVGKPTAFEFEDYRSWPEHDAIEVSAMEW